MNGTDVAATILVKRPGAGRLQLLQGSQLAVGNTIVSLQLETGDWFLRVLVECDRDTIQ